MPWGLLDPPLVPDAQRGLPSHLVATGNYGDVTNT
jgi:hypothetical protein